MITDKIFKELASIEDQTCVSIYVSTHRAGQVEKDRIELKNAIKEAHNKLETIGYSSKEADDFLSQASDLTENQDFLNSQSDTLAIFITKDNFQYFNLPIQTENYTFVGNEHYVLPLLKELNSKERFFILALSQNEVRFFEGRSTGIYPVIIEDLVPADRAEALKYYDSPEAKLQHHAGSNGGSVFHGQGGGKDVENARLEEYMRAIDSGLMEMLHDEKVPMIIAAVDFLVPMYRNISNYKYISDKQISGNPESMSPTDLHHAALEELSEHFASTKRDALESFNAFLAEDKADMTVANIIPAAINQRVDTLFVDATQKYYGTVNAATQTINIANEMTADNQELLNTAAKYTYLNGGDVYILNKEEMPNITTPLCAVYRYETVA
jgi:hypothetical protein